MSDGQQITLYSNYAHRLIQGRKADPETNTYPIFGLLVFASKVNIICNDANKSNPFATWFLIRLESKFKAFKDELATKQRWVNDVSEDGTGIKYQSAIKEADAKTISMSFGTPYAWTAMRFVKQLDSFFLLALTLKRVGLITRNEFYQSTRGLSTQILSCFHEATAYTSFELTSEDLKLLTDNAKSATKLMGAVPIKVLNGDIKPEL